MILAAIDAALLAGFLMADGEWIWAGMAGGASVAAWAWAHNEAGK